MNPNLFPSNPGALVPPTDAVNNAGGVAYARKPEEALAQFAVTGCFGDTFYVDAKDQLTEVLALAQKCSPEWIAKVAIYAAREGKMKDTPAVLCAVLAARDVQLLKRVFPVVIRNGKMLRNFVQALRSGVAGRKSFGTAVKKLLQRWFANRTDEQLFHASIGDKPSMKDIIALTHPKPATPARSAMLAYLMGKPVAAMGLLPECVQQFEGRKLGVPCLLPNLNFQFLSSLPDLGVADWTQIAEQASWLTLLMNLNTFDRHGVFGSAESLSRVIERLRDPKSIAEAQVLPSKIFAAWKHLSPSVPPGVQMALAVAMEHASNNAPKLPANTLIGVDVSGSMSAAMTGGRGSATSKIRCVDAAAMFAASMLRANPTARLCAFDTGVHGGRLGGSIPEIATALAGFGGGGTDCSLPLQLALSMERCDAVVIVSDSESWFSAPSNYIRSIGTPVMHAWRQLQRKNPEVRLVCIDLTPSTTRQTIAEKNVLNVGGFSDAVWAVTAEFLTAQKSWTDVLSSVDIPPLGG